MAKYDDGPAITVDKVGGKVNIIVDASKIDLFETCPFRFNVRHNLNLSLPIIHKNRSLDIGGLAHEGLERYYLGLVAGADYADRMQACLQKIRELGSDASVSNIDPEELTHLLNCVEESCDFWRHEDEHLEILAVEQAFAYVLYEDEFVRIIISGKIDLLVNKHGIGREATYRNLPYDHKTYQRDFPVLRTSNQFINYANACESNFLIVNRIGLQKSLKPEEKYKRLILSYDPIFIQEWKDNLTAMMLNEFMECVRTGDWVRKFTSCFKFNRLCEYHAVCDSSGAEAKAFKLANDYVKAEDWDVTKRLKAEDA